jgi:hypothetical protein
MCVCARALARVSECVKSASCHTTKDLVTRVYHNPELNTMLCDDHSSQYEIHDDAKLLKMYLIVSAADDYSANHLVKLFSSCNQTLKDKEKDEDYLPTENTAK